MSYHHGNAREVLLEVAAELLEQEGAAGLSLRRVAERAGLSRQAPYNHFDNKEALLAELARNGFLLLARRMSSHQNGPSAIEELAAAAESYIAFGVEQPALFRLMFGREFVDFERHPMAREAAKEALERLSFLIAGLDSRSDTHDATLVAWSLVHGYTHLCIETGLEHADDRSRRALLFANTINALVRSQEGLLR
ncbi:MAG TPA: TetR/AcrR family transcriptional regulator [Sphingobium sp.]